MIDDITFFQNVLLSGHTGNSHMRQRNNHIGFDKEQQLLCSTYLVGWVCEKTKKSPDRVQGLNFQTTPSSPAVGMPNR